MLTDEGLRSISANRHKKGQGVWLYDEHNHRYLDAVSSWWVNLFGHANPRISQALSEQAFTLEHTIFANFTHEPAINLAEKLAALAPQELHKVFLQIMARLLLRWH